MLHHNQMIHTIHMRVEKKKKIVTSLNTLKETLVVTTGDNYVGSAPPQLKEKLATLYNEVAGYQGAPSQNEIESINQLATETKKAIADLETILEKDWKHWLILMS